MQLAWLADFIALAETNSFTKAADLRHITRPAFGRRIRALELWCGIPLIDRSGFPVELTEQGRAFLEIARLSVRTLSEFRERASDAERAKNRSLLRIATGRTIARNGLPEWLTALRRTSPELDVRITTGSLHDSAIMLSEGHADVLITYFHPRLLLNLDSALAEFCVVTDEMLMPLSAKRDGQTLFCLPGTAAKPVPHIRFQSALALAKIEKEALKQYKKTTYLRAEIEIDSPEAALGLCIAGMGIAWLPQSLAKQAIEQDLIAPAASSDAALRFEIRAYRLKDNISPTIEPFWMMMQAMAAARKTFPRLAACRT